MPRRVLALASAVLALALLAGVGFLWNRAFARAFPPDTVPEGAYVRIAKNVGEDHMRDVFAYLETDAQWASYTIRDMRAKACARIRASYPASAPDGHDGSGSTERDALLASYDPEARAPDGADVFALVAKRKGWAARLRKDLSGVAKVEIEGARATVVTARGTRYPFRRRENGIWGLTIFTADLLAESEKATRDLAVVEAAAADYDRAAKR